MDIKKSKYFSKLVDCYFIKWIGVDTWYTGHFYDMERFYKFIHSLKRFSHKENSAKTVENMIKKAAFEHHHDFDKKELEKIAKDLSIIAMHCLGCLKAWINPSYDIEVYGLIDKEESLQLRLKYARLRKAGLEEIKCMEKEVSEIKLQISRLLKNV